VWPCGRWTAGLLRRRRTARLPAQRLVQPHHVRRRRVRAAVVLRSAQRRPATTRLPRRDAVPDRATSGLPPCDGGARRGLRQCQIEALLSANASFGNDANVKTRGCYDAVVTWLLRYEYLTSYVYVSIVLQVRIAARRSRQRMHTCLAATTL